MMEQLALLFNIAFTFFKIGIIAFGGGYAAIPIIQKQVIDINGWMTYSEFADIITIDELTPGPVAINAATFIGTKLAGVAGAIAATFGIVLPSFIIVFILIKLYIKFKNMTVVNNVLSLLRAMVVALIASTALLLVKNALFFDSTIAFESINYVNIILVILSFIALRKYKLSPILVMIVDGLITLLIYII